MMLRRFVVCACLAAFPASYAVGQEHRVEVIKQAPEATGLSKKMAAMLPKEGLRVVRGTNRTVCEIWPCEKWDITADFKQTSERLYPFQSGQLIGFVHFTRRGKDFRDQSIKRGWYSLRYGLQPTDGNHEGTSPTRDFLLMLRPEDDKSPNHVSLKKLLDASAEAAESAHPAMLCMQRTKKTTTKKPSMRYVEDKDWWILNFTGQGSARGKSKDVSVDLIVAGHADE